MAQSEKKVMMLLEKLLRQINIARQQNETRESPSCQTEVSQPPIRCLQTTNQKSSGQQIRTRELIWDSIKKLRLACQEQGGVGALETSHCQTSKYQPSLSESLNQNLMPLQNGDVSGNLQQANRANHLHMNAKTVSNFLTQPGQQNGTAEPIRESIKKLRLSCQEQGVFGGLETSGCQITKKPTIFVQSLKQNLMPVWNGNVSSNLQQSNKVNDSCTSVDTISRGAQSSVLAAELKEIYAYAKKLFASIEEENDWESDPNFKIPESLEEFDFSMQNFQTRTSQNVQNVVRPNEQIEASDILGKRKLI